MRTSIIVLAIVLMSLAGCAKMNYAELNGMTFNLEIAQTPEETSKGLMFRESLCEDCGMLFMFEEEDYHPFWMKNTLIPLDMVFISSEMEVVDVLHAEPCKTEECMLFIPKDKAKYVLEVNAYTFDATAIGKKITIN